MHILLIHQAFVSLDQAGGTRHHELARYLARRGHRVTIIASPVSYLTGRAETEMHSEKEEVDGGSLTIVRAYTYPAIHRSFVHRVLSFLSFMLSSFFEGWRVQDVDLVWGTSPPIFQAWTAWALARLKGVPFAFEVRDLWPAFAIQVGVLRHCLLIRASEWLERFLYAHADCVVVNSPGFQEYVRQRGAVRVELVPNGTDVQFFSTHADGQAFRQAHGLEDQFVVLYAGAHGMSNDLEIVLQAAQLLEEQGDILFVLLGDGKEKPALIQRAGELALRNVVFLPSIPKNRMSDALAAADACLAILKPIPLYATVFPNKVFDYMAAAKPVILAIDGVIRQVVEGAQAGVFVPPGEPHALAQTVLHLRQNPELRASMGARGRRLVMEQYDRPALAIKLAEVFESLQRG